MKIKLDIDCTPEEARKFFGLPDVGPMQDAVLEEVQERMLENLRLMDPRQMLETWFPLAAQGAEDFRKFVSSMTGRGSKKSET